MLGCTEPLISGTGLLVLFGLIAGFVTGWGCNKITNNKKQEKIEG